MSDHDARDLPEGVSEAVLSAAYRRLAKELHPDVHPGDSESERLARATAMARLNLAYDTARRTARPAARQPAQLHERAVGLPRGNDPPPSRAETDVPRRRPTLGVRTLATVAAASVVAVALLNVQSSSPVTVAVGSCVAWSGKYTATPCRSTHAGFIVSTAATPATCASRMSFMREDDHYLCIDMTR